MLHIYIYIFFRIGTFRALQFMCTLFLDCTDCSILTLFTCCIHHDHQRLESISSILIYLCIIIKYNHHYPYLHYDDDPNRHIYHHHHHLLYQHRQHHNHQHYHPYHHQGFYQSLTCFSPSTTGAEYVYSVINWATPPYVLTSSARIFSMADFVSNGLFSSLFVVVLLSTIANSFSFNSRRLDVEHSCEGG